MNEIPAQFAPDFEALKRKKEAELSGGFFRAGMLVHRKNSSRYRALLGTDEDTRLSMACLQAVLALLTRHVTSVQVRVHPQGQWHLGVMHVLSTSPSVRASGGGYRLTWYLKRQEAIYGGLSYGTTFHVPLLHLMACFAASHIPELAAQAPDHEELLKRWGDLLRLLQQQASLDLQDLSREWMMRLVEQSCHIPAMQDALERVCDALWFDLRYLPTGEARQITLFRDSTPITSLDTISPIHTIWPSDLLVPPVVRRRRQQRLEGCDAPQPFGLEQRLNRLRGDDPLPDEGG